MRVNTSACFSFALAALTLALPNTPALAFEKPSEVIAAPSNLVKANSETREERAERAARERARREYRGCSAARDCGGSRKEPGTMALLFPAG